MDTFRSRTTISRSEGEPMEHLWKETESRRTSRAAWESIKPELSRIRLLIAESLRSGDLTDDELEIRLGMRHQTVSATRRGLVKDGIVEATGDKRPTRSGRSAQVWRLVL